MHAEGEGIAPTAASVMANRLFGDSDKAAEALRGVLILRALNDHLLRLYGRPSDMTLPSLRMHVFFRSLSGLYGVPTADREGHIRWEHLTSDAGRFVVQHVWDAHQCPSSLYRRPRTRKEYPVS